MGEGHELRLEPEQDLEDVEAEDPVIGDRDELEIAVLLLDEDLPRHEVGVVLHLGQDDDVAAGDVLPAPRVRHEVDRLGRVAAEDDLVAVRGVDEAGDARPGRFVGRGRALADLVDAAVDVGVVLAVVGVHRLDDGERLLAGGGRVEVDERAAVGRRGREDRELRADHLGDEPAVPDAGIRDLGGDGRRQGHRDQLLS